MSIIAVTIFVGGLLRQHYIDLNEIGTYALKLIHYDFEHKNIM